MRPRHRYAAAAALVVAVIVYGSLYPLEFSARNGPAGPFELLASNWREPDHGTDLVANLIFYAPLGFLLAGALPGGGVLSFLAAVLLGAALSGAMELSQFYVPGRVTSLGDVEANALGTAAGAALGGIVGMRARWPLLARLSGDPPALIVLGAWFGARGYPYVPAADLHKYWEAVRGLGVVAVAPLDLPRYAAAWLAIAAIVDRVWRFRRWLVLFPLLLAAEFAVRVLMLGAELKLADIAGGALAWVGWGLVLRWLPGRLWLAGALVAAAVAALRLQPFDFGPAQKAFGWVPLLSLMSGSMNVAIPTFLEKVFFYGAAIWLLWRGGLALAWAAGGMAALLLATSGLEVFLPDRSAEITDALLAAMLGAAFALAPGRAPR